MHLYASNAASCIYSLHLLIDDLPTSREDSMKSKSDTSAPVLRSSRRRRKILLIHEKKCFNITLNLRTILTSRVLSQRKVLSKNRCPIYPSEIWRDGFA
ncbi:proteasome subunit alpha type-5 isoform X1 [Vespula squamosa]|uniref:Proteasome subunit alpha type-5 isoform X1 n=1 Tax=Vespula squamosa TaxID=30214 RepID=A0ABD1ZUX1_VESSQ